MSCFYFIPADVAKLSEESSFLYFDEKLRHMGTAPTDGCCYKVAIKVLSAFTLEEGENFNKRNIDRNWECVGLRRTQVPGAIIEMKEQQVMRAEGAEKQAARSRMEQWRLMKPLKPLSQEFQNKLIQRFHRDFLKMARPPLFHENFLKTDPSLCCYCKWSVLKESEPKQARVQFENVSDTLNIVIREEAGRKELFDLCEKLNDHLGLHKALRSFFHLIFLETLEQMQVDVRGKGLTKEVWEDLQSRFLENCVGRSIYSESISYEDFALLGFKGDSDEYGSNMGKLKAAHGVTWHPGETRKLKMEIVLDSAMRKLEAQTLKFFKDAEVQRMIRAYFSAVNR
jgi:hypothetical protein